MKKKSISLFLIIFVCLSSCSSEPSKKDIALEIQVKDNQENSNSLTKNDTLDHPFLIVTKDMYPSLREKANIEPWKSLKTDAISRANANSTSLNTSSLQKYVGAVALAYILDQDKSNSYAIKVRDAILNRYALVEIEESSSWGKVVAPMGSFFSAILALDIVYESLSIEDIIECEQVIENQISKVNREGSWKTIRYGTHGTWDLYKGIRSGPDDKYYEAIMNQITPDGVSPVTNHYAWERVGGGDSRVSKSGYMDVLEFTRNDNRYYNNERIQKFMTWLFGSSVNPSKEMAIFGDMLPTQNINNDMLHRRVVNFSLEAGGYAAWFHEGTPGIGHILTYILPKQSLPAAITPSSKIFENGGAFLREKEDNPRGLHGVLYNIMSQNEWHTHNEVNGLALSGLGNRLLVNGGRLGAPTRTAELNNTLTVNNKNHDAFTGGGTQEGILMPAFDYAKGLDGNAMNNVQHARNLFLIHSEQGAGGYFIINDELVGKEGDEIQNYLHPASENGVGIIQDLFEYTAPIDHYPTVEGTEVTICYATIPEKININKSQSAVQDRYPDYPEHNRLEATYNMNTNGEKSITTIVFPHDENIQKPVFEKLTNENYEGVTITQNEIKDFVLSTIEVPLKVGLFTFEAKFCWVRETKNKISSYFIKSGKSFLTDNYGFESDRPVTIYSNQSIGAIISNGAILKLKGSNMGSIKFDTNVKILNSGQDYIQVELEPGTFYFE